MRINDLTKSNQLKRGTTMKELTELNYPHFKMEGKDTEYGKVLLLKYCMPFLDDDDLDDGELTAFKYLDSKSIDPNRFTEDELHLLSMDITDLIRFMWRELSKRGYIKSFDTPEEYKDAVKAKEIAYAVRKNKQSSEEVQ